MLDSGSAFCLTQVSLSFQSQWDSGWKRHPLAWCVLFLEALSGFPSILCEFLLLGMAGQGSTAGSTHSSVSGTVVVTAMTLHCQSCGSAHVLQGAPRPPVTCYDVSGPSAPVEMISKFSDCGAVTADWTALELQCHEGDVHPAACQGCQVCCTDLLVLLLNRLNGLHLLIMCRKARSVQMLVAKGRSWCQQPPAWVWQAHKCALRAGVL